MFVHSSNLLQQNSRKRLVGIDVDLLERMQTLVCDIMILAHDIEIDIAVDYCFLSYGMNVLLLLLLLLNIHFRFFI